jgi:hypothetical protein
MIQQNDKVITPDGLAVVKALEKTNTGAVMATCLLEKPYTVVDVTRGIRDYGYPPFSIAYTYPLDRLTLVMTPRYDN